MIIQFLRENKAVSFVLAIIRVYLGYTWVMAGIGKLQGKGFDATGYLQGAIEKSKGAQLDCSILVGIIFTRFCNSKR